MKRNKQKLDFIIITILVWFARLILLPFVLLLLPYFLSVVLPVARAIEEEPLYWLNWHEVKRKTRKSSDQVLNALFILTGPNSSFDCQLREEAVLVRLERHLRQPRPQETRPLRAEDVVFYRFRRRAGGPRQPRRQFFSKLPLWQPIPLRA